MPVDPIMPLVFVQDMGPAAKLVHDASVRPDAAQAMAQMIAEEVFRDESMQVQKTQPEDQSAGVSKDGGGGGRGAFQERRRQQEDEENAPQPEGGDPFVGKLVNRKI